jgi:hypothetical protein
LQQTAGTSELTIFPHALGPQEETRIFSDADKDLYSWLQQANAREAFPPRTTDIESIAAAVQHGVKMYTINPPRIYGLGSGLFNRISIQMPFLMRAALEMRDAVPVIEEGKGHWSDIHVLDLADLYELLVTRIFEGPTLPASGEQGFFFAVSGEHSWLDVSKTVAAAGHKLGALPSPDAVRNVPRRAAADKWFGGDNVFIDYGFYGKYVRFLVIYHLSCAEQ